MDDLNEKGEFILEKNDLKKIKKIFVQKVYLIKKLNLL